MLVWYVLAIYLYSFISVHIGTMVSWYVYPQPMPQLHMKDILLLSSKIPRTLHHPVPVPGTVRYILYLFFFLTPTPGPSVRYKWYCTRTVQRHRGGGGPRTRTGTCTRTSYTCLQVIDDLGGGYLPYLATCFLYNYIPVLTFTSMRPKRSAETTRSS